MKSTDLQHGLDTKGKRPEDLHLKAKLGVNEVAKGLKEELQNSDANQSIEIKVPNETTTQDIDNSKMMER